MEKPGVIIIVVCVFFTSCREEKFITLSGKTMGTYYSIQYKSKNDYHEQIDSILHRFIAAASTYDPNSELSEFNRHGKLVFKTEHLYRMLKKAKEFHTKTGGAFEPTLMPLINAYGFGYSKKSFVSDTRKDSLLQLVSFSYVHFDSTSMSALKKGVQIDLSAMGEGYAIDLITDFLTGEHVTDYKVEIGGEMICKGKNQENKPWLIGIENPHPINPHDTILKYVTLSDEAISTSGSYKKYYTDNTGKRKPHLIDPKRGEPIDNTLLSVSIKAKSATVADAMATACMVMGYNSAIQLIQKESLEGLITFEKNGKVQSWHSKDFFSYIPARSLVLR